MTKEAASGDQPPWNTVDTLPATRAEASSALFDRLRAVEHDCGAAGKGDRLIALISACIAEGIQAQGQIIAVLRGLGYDRKFVGAVLSASAGCDPSRHHWRKDKTKTFFFIDPKPRVPAAAAHIVVPSARGHDADASIATR